MFYVYTRRELLEELLQQNKEVHQGRGKKVFQQNKKIKLRIRKTTWILNTGEIKEGSQADSNTAGQFGKQSGCGRHVQGGRRELEEVMQRGEGME